MQMSSNNATLKMNNKLETKPYLRMTVTWPEVSFFIENNCPITFIENKGNWASIFQFLSFKIYLKIILFISLFGDNFK